jgi:TetR/AcrR family transcriptional regulator, cholesterol catabolism regulator
MPELSQKQRRILYENAPNPYHQLSGFYRYRQGIHRFVVLLFTGIPNFAPKKPGTICNRKRRKRFLTKTFPVFVKRLSLHRKTGTMAEKFDHILKETAQLFIRYGIHSLSMDDICKELGISKKTIYQYVVNKADLVEKVLNYFIENYIKNTEVVFETGNAIDRLIELSRSVCFNMQNFNPAVTFDLQKYYSEQFRKFIQVKKESQFQLIVKNMQLGINEGLYRNDLDVSLVARIYVQKLEAILDPDFLRSDDFSFEKVFKVMFDNHIRGISNAKGISYYESIKDSEKQKNK